MSQILEWCGCDCRVERGKFDIKDIPLDCRATWRLIGSGHTIGIFQLEKELGRQWSRKVKPENINQLADLVSLMRPGCLESGMTQDYVDIKFGKKKPIYPHPALKPILQDTYSCLVYQEQAIRIAVEIAGFSLAQADNLRKGIGKKLPEVIAKLKAEFVEGAAKKGLVTKEVAEEVFSWIEKFQRYGFNKSHAVSYAMVGYQTAWLKCHFPHEFYTSYLTFSQYKGDQKEEVYRLVQDARLFGVDVLPPDIRLRNPHFMMTEEGIAFGLSHVRGVGQAAIERIAGLAGVSPGPEGPPAAENAPDGPGSLATWHGLLRAIPEIHRNVGEALVKAGACDGYSLPRTQMLAELEAVLGTATRDANGEKVEVRGLTDKEREYFFAVLPEFKTTAAALEHMAQPDAGEGAKCISKMSKSEIITTILKSNSGSSLEDLEGMARKGLEEKLRALGYKAVRKPVANDKRRAIIVEKAAQLKKEFVDSARAKAEAEKHYLGIALSCSPADEADSSLANATCLDVARAPNGAELTVCGIIDLVKHTKTKKGKAPGSPMCFITLSDSTYCLDHCVVFPDRYEELSGVCKEDLIVLVTGQKRDGSFIVSHIQKII